MRLPPEKVVDKTTWDPDADPNDLARARLEETAKKDISDQTGKGSMQDASSDEMDRIRAQLEKLL